MQAIEKVFNAVVEALCEEFPPEQVRRAIDKGLDKIEDKVAATPNKLDDLIITAIIDNVIRKPFGIADNDGIEEVDVTVPAPLPSDHPDFQKLVPPVPTPESN